MSSPEPTSHQRRCPSRRPKSPHQNELAAKYHDLQTAEAPDAEEQRELESRAAGLKAANTWHATRAIQDARAWYIEHRFLSTERAKAVTRGINDRCRLLRPDAKTLVDGFGIPEELRYAEMLHPENLPEAVTG